MLVKFDTKYKVYYCVCSFDERSLPKLAKFRWSRERKIWYTQNLNVALRLREYFDDIAQAQAKRSLIEITPWTGSFQIPNGLKPLDFQFDAAKFALERNRSYLALDPGLGKTIVAAMVANTLACPVVYVCPPFLTENVEAEFEKWAPNSNLLIVADSMFLNPNTLPQIDNFLSKNHGAILVVDEAHRFKNLSAKRTQSLFGKGSESGLIHWFNKIIFLSGTPMPNRPMELFPVLSHCAPETIGFRDQFQFGVHFCAGFQHEHGWDFTGASNMKELQANVKHRFMLRLKKELLNLPPVIDEIVTISGQEEPAYTVLNNKMLNLYNPEDPQIPVGEHVSAYRRELGSAKVFEAIHYIRELLQDTKDNILIFAHHKDVISTLKSALKNHGDYIDGSIDTKKRLEIAHEFQNNKKKRILILQLQAGGIGFNLTKANRVIFVEYSWTPADNRQAIDRAHRIGQSGSVVAQYLVLKNSFDKKVLEVNLRKAKVTGFI